MVVFWINAATDNPVGYNLWYMDPLFALIGAAYGAANATAMRESAADVARVISQSE